MIKFVRAVISSALVIVLAGLLGIFVIPRLFGWQPYMVVSASMSQVYPVGSLIFVHDAEPADIEAGDIITFNVNTVVVTHRVMEVDETTSTFVTKGDSNNVSERVSFDSLVGRATNFSIPMLGYFSSWFVTVQGKIITISVIICLALLNIVLGELGRSLNETDDDAPESKFDGKEEQI